MSKSFVGDGKVVLLSGGGRCFTDVVSRFVGSERGLSDLVGSDYDRKIVENILKSGHLAATEFDYFIFGVEGYSRVTEVQLVRKRLASYMIKSGRVNKDGKRSFDVVIPQGIGGVCTEVTIPANAVSVNGVPLPFCVGSEDIEVFLEVNPDLLLSMIEEWYEGGVRLGLPEEDLRYMKPQATEWKGVIGMNAHALIDWFKIRCCQNAQAEIRDMAWKMLRLCQEISPDLFRGAGPSCEHYGYCPEDSRQNKMCSSVKRALPKTEALKYLRGVGKVID